MCGIVGIFGHPEASTLAYLSLYALQHRGQEAAGIVSFEHEKDDNDPLPGVAESVGYVRGVLAAL